MPQKTNDFELLQELERQAAPEVKQQRAHHRISVEGRVAARPGSSSRMLERELQGVLGDISEGGCRVMFPAPLGVGDIYRLSFQVTDLELPLVFARCLRCQLIREDAFEAGFRFFEKVSLTPLQEAAAQSGGDLLA